MSRRSRAKSERSPAAWSKAAKRAAAGAGSRPRIGSIAVLTALALVVSAVFFVTLVRPDGFVAALTLTDYARLSANQRARVAPNWTTLGAHLEDEVSRSHLGEPRRALSSLLNILIELNRKKANPDAALRAAEPQLGADSDNFLSRLAFAIISDLAAPDSATGGGEGAVVRFHTIEKLALAGGPATRVRLYNQELDAAWYEVLRSEIRRQDVASNYAKFVDHGDIREQYAALPMIQRRLAALAEEIGAAGHRDEARGVRRWLVQLFVGLMRSEPDAGTRLLCADLLGRTLAGSEPELAARMAALRREYHAAADAAPVDSTDPARSPCPMPVQYRKVVNSLALATFFAVTGLGAAAILFVAVFIGLIKRVGRIVSHVSAGGEALRSELTTRNWIVRTAITIALFIGLAGILALMSPLRNAAAFSESWGYDAILCAIATGSMIVILRAAYTAIRPEPAQIDRTRLLVASPLALIPIVLIVMPSEWLAWSMRSVDMLVPSVFVLSLVLLVAVSVAYRAVRVPPRLMAASAVATWIIAMVFAYPCLAMHEIFDVTSQSMPRNLHDEEFNFRLGDDWETRFLTDIAKAYDISSS